MKKNFKYAFYALCMAGAISFTGCKEEEEANEPDEQAQEQVQDPNATSINDFVKSLSVPSQTTIEANQTTTEEITETDICSVTEKTVSESYDESVVLDPTSDAIYPGALIDGNSITTGEYRPLLGCERAPLTISTDFANTDKSSKATIENPTLSNIRDGIKESIANADITGTTTAKLSWEITEVSSKEQVEIEIGATASIGKKASISNQFNWSDESKKSRFLIKFVQTYYTIDLDFPMTPAAWFQNTTLDEFKSLLGDNPVVPCYVSSVTYGRRAYICIESSESAKEVSDALNASFQVGMVTGEMAGNLETNEVLKEAKYSGTIIGGSASDAVKAINNQEAVIEFIQNGGDFSKDSPAAMLSYRLRKLSDNTIFNVISGGTYYIRNCESKFGSYKFTAQKIECVSEYAELNGSLYASVTQGDASCGRVNLIASGTDIYNMKNGDTYHDFRIDTTTFEHVDKTEDFVLWLHFDFKNDNGQRFYVRWNNGKYIQNVSKEDGNNYSSNGTDLAILYSDLEKLRNHKETNITNYVYLDTSKGFYVNLKNDANQIVSFYFNIVK